MRQELLEAQVDEIRHAEIHAGLIGAVSQSASFLVMRIRGRITPPAAAPKPNEMTSQHNASNLVFPMLPFPSAGAVMTMKMKSSTMLASGSSVVIFSTRLPL
mmetsp:Transcript_42587/g.92788  ORF Transcript_42587/g.92788 Transcript_42587/m.92788 type:complete len:102 (+) Transcript_42587:130-435(+)